MSYYVTHPDVRIKMEQRAYGLEVRQAEEDGYIELSERLKANLSKEVRTIEENYGRS
jgi:Ni,Fe-hydrogenase maturation factor